MLSPAQAPSRSLERIARLPAARIEVLFRWATLQDPAPWDPGPDGIPEAFERFKTSGVNSVLLHGAPVEARPLGDPEAIRNLEVAAQAILDENLARLFTHKMPRHIWGAMLAAAIAEGLGPDGFQSIPGRFAPAADLIVDHKTVDRAENGSEEPTDAMFSSLQFEPALYAVIPDAQAALRSLVDFLATEPKQDESKPKSRPRKPKKPRLVNGEDLLKDLWNKRQAFCLLATQEEIAHELDRKPGTVGEYTFWKEVIVPERDAKNVREQRNARNTINRKLANGAHLTEEETRKNRAYSECFSFQDVDSAESS